MSIVLVGLNHKTAPVEVRERLAFTDEACADSLRALVDGEVVREGLIVSTCNRVEILTAAAGPKGAEAAERLSRFLSDARAVPVELFNGHLYTHADEAAVRHVFRVASSLDSLVVGEPQVLGQVRHAYTIAVEAGTAGRGPPPPPPPPRLPDRRRRGRAPAPSPARRAPPPPRPLHRPPPHPPCRGRRATRLPRRLLARLARRRRAAGPRSGSTRIHNRRRACL